MQSSTASSNLIDSNISRPEEPKRLVSSTTTMCTAVVSAGLGRLQLSAGDISEDEPEYEGAEGFTMLNSPCVNLGRDFELLVSQCIAEKKAREERRSQEIADDNCNEETDATTYTHVTMEEVDDAKEVTVGPEKSDKSSEAVIAVLDVTEKPVNEVDTAAISYEDEGKMVDNQSNYVSEQLAEAMVEDVGMDLTDECEWPILGCGCYKVETPKPSVGTSKPEVKKAIKTKRAKKWKPVSQVQLGFNYSVLLRQQYVDDSQEDEMDAELLEFEKALDDALKEEDEKERPDKVKDEPKEVKKSKSANKRIRKCKNRLKRNASENSALQEDLLEDAEKKIIMGTTDSKLLRIMCFEGSRRSQIYLRRKHKWRRDKTHKAIKSKQCIDFGIKSHGQMIYVSSHIHKKIEEKTGFCCRLAHTLPKPKLHPGYKDIKSITINPVYAAGAHANGNRPAQRKNYPVAKPVPKHTLNANNADAEIPADILNVLMGLQDRDLTPEDYEILLRLDERVKPKTLEEEVLASFRTEEVTQEIAQSGGEPCAVCMDPYAEGQFRKFLPCGHGFHSDCIDMWLKNSSMNCPLDGLPVTEN